MPSSKEAPKWYKVYKAIRTSHFMYGQDFEKGFLSVQKRVNIAGLKLLSLESHDCKACPWLASGYLDFGSVLILSYLKRVACSASIIHMNSVVYAETLLSI